MATKLGRATSYCIPDEWIKQYVDQLLDGAAKLEAGRFRDALLLRADHVMDLVKAWRESKDRRSKDGG